MGNVGIKKGALAPFLWQFFRSFNPHLTVILIGIELFTQLNQS